MVEATQPQQQQTTMITMMEQKRRKRRAVVIQQWNEYYQSETILQEKEDGNISDHQRDSQSVKCSSSPNTSTSDKRRVQFANPLVSQVRERPLTRLRDVESLYYQTWDYTRFQYDYKMERRFEQIQIQLQNERQQLLKEEYVELNCSCIEKLIQTGIKMIHSTTTFDSLSSFLLPNSNKQTTSSNNVSVVATSALSIIQECINNNEYEEDDPVKFLHPIEF